MDHLKKIIMEEDSVYKMPNQYDYHGLKMNKYVYPPEHVDEARNLELKSDDILVASYPRTGKLVIILLSKILCFYQTFSRNSHVKNNLCLFIFLND